MKINVRLSSRGKSRSIIFRISLATYEISGSEKKYKQLDYSTGLTVKVKDWSNTHRRTKNDSYKNGQIARGLIRVEEIGSKLASENNLSFSTLRVAVDSDEKLNEIFNKDRKILVEKEYTPPFEFINTYIDKANVSAGTKKDYTNTLNHLIAFDKYRGKTISWKSINYNYYLELIEYLKNETLKPSTIDKIVKNLKVFLTQADLTDNLEVNQDFKKTISGKSLFGKVNKDEATHVYLNESEVKQITDTLIQDSKLSEIRDLFIIGCWTGLRISDLSRLQTSNIKDGLITITTKKTRQAVSIPITKELQAILDKHPDKLPKAPSDQHYNRELKKVCEIAELNELIMAEQRKGNLFVTAPTPKHQLITSHTARRSFATNLYRRGIPSTQLMKLTGHRTEEAFMKYIKVTNEDNARDVAKQLKKFG